MINGIKIPIDIDLTKAEETIKKALMRFHPLTANTSKYLPMHASNNHPYGPPPLTPADDDLPFEFETVKAAKSDDDLLSDD